MRPKSTLTGSIKIETNNPGLQQRRADVIRGSSLGYLPTMEEIIGWTYNALLTSINFKYADGVWCAVIKVVKDGSPLVSYVNVGKFGRCVEVVIELASKKLLIWYPDKYPVRTRTRKKRPVTYGSSLGVPD